MIRTFNLQRVVRTVLLVTMISLILAGGSAPAQAGWLSDLGHKIAKAVNVALDWYGAHAKPSDPRYMPLTSPD